VFSAQHGVRHENLVLQVFGQWRRENGFAHAPTAFCQVRQVTCIEIGKKRADLLGEATNL